MPGQVENKGGFASNLTAQLVVLAALVVILVVIAARYMW